MRPGVRIGVDVGTARIGVASSDSHGMLATPVATVARGGEDIEQIAAYVAEYGAFEVVVGLPLSLKGTETASTRDARSFAAQLRTRLDASVRLVDERLSTVSAQRSLRESGRNSRSQRPVVDQVAAVIILQHALDAERSGGVAPGSLVQPLEGT